MPTNKVHLGENQAKFAVSPDKLEAVVLSPLVRAGLVVGGSAGQGAATSKIGGIEIPAGAIVTRVALRAKTAVVSSTPSGTCDIDVGDSSGTTRFIDSMSSLAANVLNISTSGKYYATQDEIKVVVNATAKTGTVDLLVWYDIDDSGVVA